MRQVPFFHVHQNFGFRRKPQMLDTMAKFVKTGNQKARGNRSRGGGDATDCPTDGNGNAQDGRDRRVKGPEQYG